MNRSPGHTRRNFLRATSAAGLAAASGRVTLPEQQQAASKGSVTPSDGGEHLIHFRDGGNLFIKFGLASGSPNLAMGTQQVTIGTGIPVHRHLQTDEAFYVLGGSGTFLLNDVPTPIETGATLFIPRNTWHGFVNHDHELLLLWTVTPAGFEGFFRDTAAHRVLRKSTSRANRSMSSQANSQPSSDKANLASIRETVSTESDPYSQPAQFEPSGGMLNALLPNTRRHDIA